MLMNKFDRGVSVIDFEASGLSTESYPIEIGIALANGRQFHSLIKPLPSWTHWDDEAQQMHGIPREDLFRHGRPIIEICKDINRICRGMTLYSDCWVYDYSWFNQLFAAEHPTMTCSPIENLLKENQLASYFDKKPLMFERLSLKPHRALNDALTIKQTLIELISNREERRNKVRRYSPRELGASAVY